MGNLITNTEYLATDVDTASSFDPEFKNKFSILLHNVLKMVLKPHLKPLNEEKYPMENMQSSRF